MQFIEIEPTYKSPKVIFDPKSGNMKIEGKSILVNVEEFYKPLINWLDEFITKPTCNSVEFTFDIEYFNLASTKRFMFILIKLKELLNKNIKVNVIWAYSSNDTYSLEMGEDLSQMLDIPITFVAYERAKDHSLKEN